MQIHADSLVADIASAAPSTMRVFARHEIDFCCGGRKPLSQVCLDRGLDVDFLLTELSESLASPSADPDWREIPLGTLIAHIQSRYHVPLREELPRLAAMLDKVVTRHGDRLPDTLAPLQGTFDMLRHELLEHMAKEDAVLFPAILALEAGADDRSAGSWLWIDQPISVMEAEHASAGAALERMRALTGGYTPPEGACPTWRGLYHGLAELERDMHQHVHLENHVLFPRAAALAHAGREVKVQPDN